MNKLIIARCSMCIIIHHIFTARYVFYLVYRTNGAAPSMGRRCAMYSDLRAMCSVRCTTCRESRMLCLERYFSNSPRSFFRSSCILCSL